MILPCDNHQDTVAVVLMTNLETGDTLTLCGPCQLGWCRLMVELTEHPDALGEISTPQAEEVADLEPELPAPDAESKSEPEPATPPASEAEYRAEIAQESTAPGE